MGSWTPVGELSSFESMPVDSRIIEEIQRNPKKSSEQGSNFLYKWGGPENYKVLANLTSKQRVVYAATCQGLSDPDSIAEAVSTTDTFNKEFKKLDSQDIQKVEAGVTRADVINEVLKDLQKKGLVRYA